MKWLYISCIIVFIAVTVGISRDEPIVTNNSSQQMLGGEHTCITWSGIDTVGTGTVSATNWMQTGFAWSAAHDSNRFIQRFNPEFFTLLINLVMNESTPGADDSVGLGAIRFELAYDTTDNQGWLADSTNLFMADGNWNHDQYGIWMFEDIPANADTTEADTLVWVYPLRIPSGSYMRLVFTGRGDMTDSVAINWKLIGEH